MGHLKRCEEAGELPRVEELAQKSSAGTLTPEEQNEYAEIVRMNDTLSVLKPGGELVGGMCALCRCSRNNVLVHHT
jgi:hypothetical protein